MLNLSVFLAKLLNSLNSRPRVTALRLKGAHQLLADCMVWSYNFGDRGYSMPAGSELSFY